MKLKDFLDNINKMVEENPSILDLDVVYARDPEGNGFYPVYYTPSIGCHLLEDDDWIAEAGFQEFVEEQSDFYGEECEPLTVNAICIN